MTEAEIRKSIAEIRTAFEHGARNGDPFRTGILVGVDFALAALVAKSPSPARTPTKKPRGRGAKMSGRPGRVIA